MALLPMLLGGPTTGVISVGDLIRGAMRVLGVLAAEETPQASEVDNALTTLNEMLDSWSNERLALFATERTAYTLTPGLNPHTLGVGGTFNATRPLRVDRASLVLASSANAELPLRLVSDEEWRLTQGKTTTGTPVNLWIETLYPTVNLWLNPVPVNADSLVLYTWMQLGGFGSTNLSVDLPPGYARALRYNLAMELAPEYGVVPSPTAQQIANESLAALKRLNIKPNYLRADPALLRSGPFNLIAGDK